MEPRVTEGLQDLLRPYTHWIDLYMCADEHNQQYLTPEDYPPEVISGSGGTKLDTIIHTEGVAGLHMARPTFGFVSVNVDVGKLIINFHSVDGRLDTEQFVVSRKRE